MSNVALLKPRSPLPHDASLRLRNLAAAVERGEIKSYVAVYDDGAEFGFVMPSSDYESLSLAAMLMTYVQKRIMGWD